VVSQGPKSRKEEEFVGPSWGVFLIPSNVDEKGANQEKMNQIDPDKGGTALEPSICLIGMID
jgi:hypothetical protein